MAEKPKNTAEYIAQFPKWSEQLSTAQSILDESPLEATIKWGAPCYTYKGTNCIGLAGFKNHCAIWFHKGALLKDEAGLFENAQPGKTKLLRQWRFRESEQVNIPLLKKYIAEMIALEDSGSAAIPKTSVASVAMPPVLKKSLADQKPLQVAFEALTPFKQREYKSYILDAKREATKLRRLEKIIPLILEGKGLNDKYKNC